MSEELRCEECNKKFKQGFVLAVIDDRPGATSFMRHFCTQHWQKHIIDCVVRVIVDFPELKKYFDKRLKFMQQCKDEGKI